MRVTQEFLSHALALNNSVTAQANLDKTTSHQAAIDNIIKQEKIGKKYDKTIPSLIQDSVNIFDNLPWTTVTKSPDTDDTKYIYEGPNKLHIEQTTFSDVPMKREILINTNVRLEGYNQAIILLFPREESEMPLGLVEITQTDPSGKDKIVVSRELLSENLFSPVLNKINKSIYGYSDGM